MTKDQEIMRLTALLARTFKEAEEWLFDGRGCKPEDICDYDGWADEVRQALKDYDADGDLGGEHF